MVLVYSLLLPPVEVPESLLNDFDLLQSTPKTWWFAKCPICRNNRLVAIYQDGYMRVRCVECHDRPYTVLFNNIFETDKTVRVVLKDPVLNDTLSVRSFDPDDVNDASSSVDEPSSVLERLNVDFDSSRDPGIKTWELPEIMQQPYCMHCMRYHPPADYDSNNEDNDAEITPDQRIKNARRADQQLHDLVPRFRDDTD
jgi:hypothetical protein